MSPARKSSAGTTRTSVRFASVYSAADCGVRLMSCVSASLVRPFALHSR